MKNNFLKKSSTWMMAGMLICLQAFSNSYNKTGIQLMRSNLNIEAPDGSTTLLDGDLTLYDPSFSNGLDGMDARKISNFSENIGMERASVCLAIERRHTIDKNDTIFYKIWNLCVQRNYQLEFDASNLSQPGLSGYVEDLYLHTKTPINLEGSGFLNFSINADTASSNVYRFRVIFTTAGVGRRCFNFSGPKAYEYRDEIHIDWTTAFENNLKDYTVERSSDGKNFGELVMIEANNLPVNNYSYVDDYPATGFNYYRVRSTDGEADTKYSEVVKVVFEKDVSLMRVFPNPVINKTINLQVENEPAGQYIIRLISRLGQLMISKEIKYPGGTNTVTVTPPQNMPSGIYVLEITAAGGTKTNISVVY